MSKNDNTLERFRGNSKTAVQPTQIYFDAQKKWYERTGDIMGQKNLWQAVALVAMFAALTAIGGLIIVACRSQFVPYVVQVDKLGQPAAVRRADVAENVSEKVVIYMLASYITAARTVCLDEKMMADNVWKAYALLRAGDPATIKMAEYYKDKELSPLHHREGTVSVEVVSVLRQNEETWEVSWYETEYQSSGTQKKRRRMRALLNVYIQPPISTTTEEEIRRNPLGVYIKDYSWGIALE